MTARRGDDSGRRTGPVSGIVLAHDQATAFSATLSDAVTAAALEVLGTLREPWMVVPGALTSGGSEEPCTGSVGDQIVRAVLSFTGGVAGHLMVSATSEHARSIYRLVAPGEARAEMAILQDLVGELCNQILGRINAFFVIRGVPVHHGTPTPKQPAPNAGAAVLRLSLAHALNNGAETRVDLAYVLDDFDASRLLAPELARVLELDVIRYM